MFFRIFQVVPWDLKSPSFPLVPSCHVVLLLQWYQGVPGDLQDRPFHLTYSTRSPYSSNCLTISLLTSCILGVGKFSHITPALYELHWLPVSLRIDYKILLLTFKCIFGLAPTYLSDLISIKSNSLYSLRSTGKLLLDHP